MNWLSIGKIHVHPFYSKELRTRFGKLNDAVDGILQRRAAIEQRSAEARSADPESFDFAAGSQLKLDAVQLLQDELRTRREWADAWAHAQQELRKQSDRLFTKLEEAKADIRRKLLEMGYLPESDEPTPGKLNQGMILGHPVCIALRNEQQSIGDQARDEAGLQANAAGIDRVGQLLRRARDSAAAVA